MALLALLALDGIYNMTIYLSQTGGGGGLGPGEAFVPFPSNYPNPYTVNGRKYLKTGTTMLAAPYPNAPTVVYGQNYLNHTCWLSSYSYSRGDTSVFMKNDGSSNVLAVGSGGQFAAYSTNGGQTWPSQGNSTGLSSTTVNDMCWHAAASLFVIATASGLYTCPVGSNTFTLRQAGNFVSVASNGTTLIATQNTAANANTTTFYTSTNATTWAAQTGVSGLSTSSFIYSCIRYLNGLWIVVGNTALYNSNNVYTSTNGTTWTSVGTTTYGGINDIAYGNGYYVFINGYAGGSSASAMYYSSLSGMSVSKILGLYVYGATSGVQAFGQLAWNGYYFVVAAITNGNTTAACGFALAPDGSASFGFAASGFANSSYNGGGSSGGVCAFTSGAYAGTFIGLLSASFSGQIWNTYAGTYIDVGRNITSTISNLIYFGRIS